VVNDNEGGFAGVLASTVQLRRYSEVNGAYGPVLGHATVVDAYTIRVTDINVAVNQEFTFSVDLTGPVQLESARAYGIRN
jgi:hypothetical protein